MITLYRVLLLLYPVEHRECFGEEMLDVFQCASAEASEHGVLARITFWAREIAGIISAALQEHLRALIGARFVFPMSNGSLLSRRLVMRNGFRFPKSTAVLMTLILGGVVLAIRKGEVIATSLPPFSQPITPTHPAHSYLLPGVAVGFILFYAAGLVGWAVLFALRRSGVHRLDDVSAGRK